MVREMQLEDTYIQYPSSMQREWTLAQGHLLSKSALTDAEKASVSARSEKVA